MVADLVDALGQRIEKQRLLVDQWRRPVEALLFETLRAIDHLYSKELFTEDPSSSAELSDPVATWGVNHVLSRMIPDTLASGPFRLFPSNSTTQSRADEFLFQSGVLHLAELAQGWISDGLVSARIDRLAKAIVGGTSGVLVLKSSESSIVRDVIAGNSRGWMSELVQSMDRSWQESLEVRHAELIPELERHVGTFGGWGISYTSTREIDDYFGQWGQVYLRRLWSQDLLGLDDKIGGAEFRDYLGVAAALSGRAQKHLCFASILSRRNPGLDLRNLLTTFAGFEEFLTALASHLDADTLQIQKLLVPLTLEPSNKEIHTSNGDVAWAPLVRVTNESYMLPLYGLEINPFLFLLNDLRARYPRDWFAAANNRERRWAKEIDEIFPSDRWIAKHGIKLKIDGKVSTDIDTLVYDSNTNELMIIQLKWQDPPSSDNRRRRSSGKNLISQGDAWLAAVGQWLDRFGFDELSARSGINFGAAVRPYFFIMARYSAHFSGYMPDNGRAIWTDWNHFLRARIETLPGSIEELRKALEGQIKLSAAESKQGFMLPLQDLALILNPTAEPSGSC